VTFKGQTEKHKLPSSSRSYGNGHMGHAGLEEAKCLFPMGMNFCILYSKTQTLLFF